MNLAPPSGGIRRGEDGATRRGLVSLAQRAQRKGIEISSGMGA